MKRLAIIDHGSHTLYVEDVNEDTLEKMYGGDEQAYIDDTYTFDGDYSWDWITDAEYIGEGESAPMDIDFENLFDYDYE